MKNILMMSFVSVAMLVASSAFAYSNDISVLKVKQYANLMPPLPPGGAKALSKIEITYRSCAKFSADRFDVALAAEGGDAIPSLVVSVKPDTIDCMGPTRLQSETLRSGNLPLLEKVFVQQNGQQVVLDVESHVVH